MDLVFIMMNKLKLIQHLYDLLSYYFIYYHFYNIYIVQNIDLIFLRQNLLLQHNLSW